MIVNFHQLDDTLGRIGEAFLTLHDSLKLFLLHFNRL